MIVVPVDENQKSEVVEEEEEEEKKEEKKEDKKEEKKEDLPNDLLVWSERIREGDRCQQPVPWFFEGGMCILMTTIAGGFLVYYFVWS